MSSAEPIAAPTAIDLFAGCGGLTEGLAAAGFTIVAAVELEKLAAETYRANHPDVRVLERDIRNVRPDRLIKQLGLQPGDLTLLAGCPPCQGYSSIRRRNKAGAVKDPRNDLVRQMLRFARVFMPKAVMMENVPGLVGDKRLVALKRGLGRLGYVCQDLILDAAHYGVPQRRKRLVLLAGFEKTLSMPPRKDEPKTVRDTIADLTQAGH